MVSAFNLGLSGSGLGQARGHCQCCVLEQNALASLHPGVQMGSSEHNAGGKPVMDWHSIRGREEAILVTSYATDRNWR